MRQEDPKANLKGSSYDEVKGDDEWAVVDLVAVLDLEVG